MKILIIGPSWVGDSVMAQTLYKRLKDEEPSCTIDVISPEWSLPLMQRMPEVSKVITSPYSHGDIRIFCLLYTSPSPRDLRASRMPSSA